jgi:hypothetical protein
VASSSTGVPRRQGALSGVDLVDGSPPTALKLTKLRVSLWSRESLLMAEAVEKVVGVKIFETIIQNSRLLRINITASAAHTNNSCAKFDGPDFFNSLSQKRA